MDHTKTFRYSFRDLGLTVQGVLEVIGYNDESEREYVSSLIEAALTEAGKIADIRTQYKVFEGVRFNAEKKSVGIGEEVFNVGKIVFSQLKKSESAALFLCTAGQAISDRSKKAMHEGDLLTGYIFDVIGSEIVEAAADLMQEDLTTSAAASGVIITNRYSPGYCGWNVDEQHRLFTFFAGNFCGIKLTPSALMDPVKSISGLIGIGKSVRMNPYTCTKCEMKDCIYRKVREHR